MSPNLDPGFASLLWVFAVFILAAVVWMAIAWLYYGGGPDALHELRKTHVECPCCAKLFPKTEVACPHCHQPYSTSSSYLARARFILRRGKGKRRHSIWRLPHS